MDNNSKAIYQYAESHIAAALLVGLAKSRRLLSSLPVPLQLSIGERFPEDT